MTLDDVLRPITVGEFMDEYVGERFLRLPGTPGRFESLAPWPDINATLERMRFSGNRLQLVQRGDACAPETFMRGLDDPRGAFVDDRRLEAALDRGATLIVNQVDEFLPQVRTFAESCQRHFRMYVGVNLYASWRSDNGFLLHWDNYDTLIVQVSGRKRWRLFAPTAPYPLRGTRPNPRPPSGDPVWEGVLESGGVLYVPRGWWHVVTPVDEPTVHLTVALAHPTGIDALRWVVTTLSDCADVRRVLPHWRTAAERQQCAATLRELVTAAMTDDLIDRVLNAADDRIPVRPRLRLPVTREQPLTPESELWLSTASRIHISDADGAGQIRGMVGSVEWHGPAACGPALQQLEATSGTTLGALMEMTSPDARAALQTIIDTLVERGVVWSKVASPATDQMVVHHA